MHAAPTNAERIATATQSLAPITDTPRLDAEILLAHALRIPRASLLARLRECASVPEFDALLGRRLASEPIAYILGEWEFFSLLFRVRPPLLVPRPETEHLVESVLDFVGRSPAEVLEIGTGTGCVAVSVARNAPESRVVATDINPIAIETAAENCRRHGVDNRVTLQQGDLFKALHAHAEFDVICSNPPYIEDGYWEHLPSVIRLYEDPGALLAGPEGLDVIRRLAESAPHYLRPGGLLAFEIGIGQHGAVEALLSAYGYHDIRFRPDLAGIPRIALAERPLAS